MLHKSRSAFARFSAYNIWRCASRRPLSTATGKSLPSHYTLPSGDKIPSIALGMWKAGKGEAYRAVESALAAGYRHVDNAWHYQNEEEVGQAIQKSDVSRSDIWLTSKLWNEFHAPTDVEAALDDSLRKLRTDYLDLYLIHWPIAFKKGGRVYYKTLSENTYPTWQKLEEMVDKGKVRNIGISNFNIRRINDLMKNQLKHKPAVLQVEMSFWNPQPELLEARWAKERDLLVESYSPLGSNNQVKETLNATEVRRIAEALGITPAQVVISWHVQRGTVVLPKSVHPNRIEENLQIMRLPDDMFMELESAASAHPPMRVVNPSKGWGLNFDIFEY